MEKSKAVVLQKNDGQVSVVASSGRISTQSGTALEIYAKSGEREKDLRLIGKVLSSGHKSVIEHQSLSVAFNDVSVMVEQFVIEYRLAAYTVKSRRYVDFSDAGYVIPADMSDTVLPIYKSRTEQLFAAYDQLLQLDIPKEDARFVLPYGFRSNFFVTMDARELIHMICAMLRGRGARFAEIRQLGRQLKDQFDELYPDVLDAQLRAFGTEAVEQMKNEITDGSAVKPDAAVISAPQNAMAVLKDAVAFGRRFPADMCVRDLLVDERPRELELLNYAFRIENISLACVTHFTRHRMLSLMLHHEYSALAGGNFVLPDSIAANPQARRIYEDAFRQQTAAAKRAKAAGASDENMVYFAMAGHTTSMLISMNARELLHFSKLRSCSRAQWEIRGVARKMIALLNETDGRDLFKYYGPTCAVTGKCPEGRMTCGRPVRIENGVWTTSEKN